MGKRKELRQMRCFINSFLKQLLCLLKQPISDEDKIMGLEADINEALDANQTSLDGLQSKAVEVVAEVQALIASGGASTAQLQAILTKVQNQAASLGLVKTAVEQADADLDAATPVP